MDLAKQVSSSLHTGKPELTTQDLESYVTNHGGAAVFGAVVPMLDPALHDQREDVRMRAGEIAGSLGCIQDIQAVWLKWAFSRLDRDLTQGTKTGICDAFVLAIRSSAMKGNTQFVESVNRGLLANALIQALHGEGMRLMLPVIKELLCSEIADENDIKSWINILVGWCISDHGDDRICRWTASILRSCKSFWVEANNRDFGVRILDSSMHDIRVIPISNSEKLLNCCSTWVALWSCIATDENLAEQIEEFASRLEEISEGLLSKCSWDDLDGMTMRLTWWLRLLAIRSKYGKESVPEKLARSLAGSLSVGLKHASESLLVLVLLNLKELVKSTYEDSMGLLMKSLLYGKDTALRFLGIDVVPLGSGCFGLIESLYIESCKCFRICADSFAKEVKLHLSHFTRQTQSGLVSIAIHRRIAWLTFLLRLCAQIEPFQSLHASLSRARENDLQRFPELQIAWLDACKIHNVPLHGREFLRGSSLCTKEVKTKCIRWIKSGNHIFKETSDEIRELLWEISRANEDPKMRALALEAMPGFHGLNDLSLECRQIVFKNAKYLLVDLALPWFRHTGNVWRDSILLVPAPNPEDSKTFHSITLRKLGNPDAEASLLNLLRQQYLATSCHDVVHESCCLRWNAWWVAQSCVWFRLRTEYGGAAKTLERFEKLLEEGKNTFFVCTLVENLERLFNLIGGKLEDIEIEPRGFIRIAPEKSTRTFFQNNRTVCDEWIGRIRFPKLFKACGNSSLGLDVAQIWHGLRHIERARTKRTRYDPSIVEDLAMLFCFQGNVDAMSGLAYWVDELESENKTGRQDKVDGSSIGHGTQIPWIEALGLVAKGHLESAVNKLQAEIRQQFNLRSVSAVQIMVWSSVECLSRLGDWDELDKWLRELSEFQEQAWSLDEESLADALTPHQDLELLQCFAALDRGLIHDAAKRLEHSIRRASSMPQDFTSVQQVLEIVDRNTLAAMLIDHGFTFPGISSEMRNELLDEADELLAQPLWLCWTYSANTSCVDVTSRVVCTQMLRAKDAEQGLIRIGDGKRIANDSIGLNYVLRVSKHMLTSDIANEMIRGNYSDLLLLVAQQARKHENLRLAWRCVRSLEYQHSDANSIMIAYEEILLKQSHGMHTMTMQELGLLAHRCDDDTLRGKLLFTCASFAKNESKGGYFREASSLSSEYWEPYGNWAHTQGLEDLAMECWIKALGRSRKGGPMGLALKVFKGIIEERVDEVDVDFYTDAWTHMLPQILSACSSGSKNSARVMGICEKLLAHGARENWSQVMWPLVVASKAHVVNRPEIRDKLGSVIAHLKQATTRWEEEWYSLIQNMFRTDKENRKKTIGDDDVRALEDLYKKTIGLVENSKTKPKQSGLHLSESERAFTKTLGGKIKEAMGKLRGNLATLRPRTDDNGLEEQAAQDVDDEKRNPNRVLREVWEYFENDLIPALRAYLKDPRNTCTTIQNACPQLWQDFKAEGSDDIDPEEEKGTIRIPMPKKQGVWIERIENRIEVLDTKTRPKRLWFHGSDGKAHGFLLKGGEDVRLDERIQQLFTFANEAFRRSDVKQFTVHAFNVIPLGRRIGLIEWVDNTIPMHRVYRQWETSNPDQSRKSYRALIIKGLQAKLGIDEFEASKVPRRDWPKDVLVQVFDELNGRTPGDLLARLMWATNDSSASWWNCVSEYGKSLAITSMLGHVIGLGDRHLANILFNYHTGSVVHIDFGICFDKGAKLPIPETVPFRLTKMLQGALPLQGADSSCYEGIFGKACVSCMRILCQNSDTIKIWLETLVHDPLLWSGNAEKVLAQVSKKLQDPDSVQALISQARNREKLAYMYEGWAAWI